MESRFSQLAAALLNKEKKHRRWIAVVLCMAMAVALGTNIALTLQGIAKSHQKRVLDCALEVHEHDRGACYDRDGMLICGYADYVVHTHNEDCYDEEGKLVCKLPEIEKHEHTGKCYREEKVLVCTLDETEGHQHSNDCYTLVRGDLTCSKEETDGHVHADDCYDEEGQLICDLEAGAGAHAHSDDCYAWNKELRCGKSEGEGAHRHGKDCYNSVKELKCGELELHTHDRKCYDKNGNLICGRVELLEHIHGKNCFKEVELTEEEIAALNGMEGEPEDQAVDESQEETLEQPTETAHTEDEAAADAEIEQTEGALEADIREEQLPAEETEVPAMPEQTFEGKAGDVAVYVKAPEGAFPEGTTMQVTAIQDTQVMDTVAEAVEGEVTGVKAVDITFIDAEGNVIQPAVEINVTLTDEAPKQEDQPVIVHVDSENNANVVESKVADDFNQEISFDAGSFSIYAIAYTVDFHYEVDGKTFEYSILGGTAISMKDLLPVLGVVMDAPETEVNEVQAFLDQIADVTFSDESLMKVVYVEAETTVGRLREENKLAIDYSAELTDEEIAQINEQTIEAGDWALISLCPFDTEETLTVAMKNGDQFVIQVTDAHEIADAKESTIDVNKSYLICYHVGNTYHLLKNDGTVDSTHNPSDFEDLNSTYCWSFNFVFEEKDREGTLEYNYYLIRPIDHKSKTMALNAVGEPLVQQGNNNVALAKAEGGGFHFGGYHDVWLNFADGVFSAVQLPEEQHDQRITLSVYEMDALPTYDYAVRSSDETRGTVSVVGGTSTTVTQDNETYALWSATSNHDKKNAGTITATPVDHKNTSLSWSQTGYNQNKWAFDHWEQDGIPLDKNQYPAKIDAGSLPIPFNGSNLVAFFRQNPSYVVPDNEKTPMSFEDMTNWMSDLKNRSIPLDEAATEKTAEVYDYENRIYRVDLKTKANFETFDGNVDMAFCLDVSNSMKFPSKLVKANTNYNGHTNPIPIYQINNSGGWWNNRTWLDTNRGYNNPYYLIADASGTATVFKVYYKDGYWKAQDASRPVETEKSFKIGQEDFNTNYGEDARHPFTKGDNDNSTYTIYNDGDEGRDRFHYLNQSLTNASTDLKDIKALLEVAGADSPNVRVAYNTFNMNLGSQKSDFADADTLSVDFTYSAGGGTRPDQAFNDLKSYHWDSSSSERYVVLITDGAPQGKRDGEGDNLNYFQIARSAAESLRSEKNVKLITIGLSMENVTAGRQLLYDIADKDKNGDKMFYLAESGSDLTNILRKIIQTIMTDATVNADITDTVGDAFYLVNKETGLPLSAGQWIDIDGNVTTDQNKRAGVVQNDGRTIKWIGQSVDQTNGWHGTVYVKAKEDLIGANAAKTNSSAEIKATSYIVGGRDHTFNESLLNDKLKSLQITPPTPRVNVNELHFPEQNSEWTVYLGTEVDPKEQLQKLYEAILVDEVVNADGSLHYPIAPNSIKDDRENQSQGTPQTFPLAPVILDQIKANNALKTRYIKNNNLNWDVFLADILNDEGVTIPYHPYGIEGKDSRIVVRLTKAIREGEESDLVNQSPHAAVVKGAEVEKYVLNVKYYPDYDHVLPVGQGGHNTEDFHTGTYGSMYQGHSAGNETSVSTHKINVYVKGLKITKVDSTNRSSVLTDAEFKLFRTARTGEIPAIQTWLNGDYVEVSDFTMSNGVGQIDELPLLKENEHYFLVETKTPNGYDTLPAPLEVQIDLQDNFWTLNQIKETDSPVHMKPTEAYHWDQDSAVMIAGGSTEYVYRLDENDEIVSTGAAVVNDHNEGLAAYKIGNNPGVELPDTGGSGTQQFYLLGSILIVMSGASILLMRRKRKTE